MQLTVLFTDVYDGCEYPRTEFLEDVRIPTVGEDINEWADEVLYPLTGDGRVHDESGYFAQIVEFPGRKDLVGHEFSWGV